jgi:hypothetical protein
MRATQLSALLHTNKYHGTAGHGSLLVFSGSFDPSFFAIALMNCSAPIEKSWMLGARKVEVVFWPDSCVADKLERERHKKRACKFRAVDYDLLQIARPEQVVGKLVRTSPGNLRPPSR